jgi:UDP-N-acetylmuramoyl-tripeptide--D-alanyl-D-alanine ligase
MSALWTAYEAEAATGGKAVGDWQVSGVSIDTRTLELGDLFVALTDVRDGHDFVAQALKNGAGAALVSHRPEGVAKEAPLLIVDDVLHALEALGSAARARCKGKVIAVTGSVGKTTTKEMLRTALEGQGRIHVAVMSLNNHWGVPLTLARMPRDTDFAVIEIGMNHAGEITPLSQFARPEVSIVTTVAEAHMAAFADVTEIARAKAEIFDGMQAGGIAILNRDIATFDILADAAKDRGVKVVTFGADQGADNRLEAVQQNGGVSVVSAILNNHSTLFKIGAPGQHLAINALAVLAAVTAVGADPVVAALDLAQWQPPQGRGQRHWIALDPLKDELRLELIDDAYNANPASMRAAFAVLADSTPIDGIGRVKQGRRIAFLSDMLELGEIEVAHHTEIATLPSMNHIDIVHLAGPLMQHLHHALAPQIKGEWYATAAELAARAHSLLDAGDVAMVKGSKGSRASLVVDAILKLGQANSGS